jgi:hypothetical protein
MTTRKITSTHRKTRPATIQQPSLYHRIDTLLHTMRCIAQYEDALCGLSHEVKRAGAFSPEISDEVREILDKIPSHDYVMDLDAVRAALSGSKPSKKTLDSNEPAKAATSRKSPPVAKKKSGRKSSR